MKRDERRFARFGPAGSNLDPDCAYVGELARLGQPSGAQIAASESLLCLNFRDRLDPSRFRSGKGDLIASMQRV